MLFSKRQGKQMSRVYIIYRLTLSKHCLPRAYQAVDGCRQIPASLWGMPVSESKKEPGCLRTFHTPCSCPGSFPRTPEKHLSEVHTRPIALKDKCPPGKRDNALERQKPVGTKVTYRCLLCKDCAASEFIRTKSPVGCKGKRPAEQQHLDS